MWSFDNIQDGLYCSKIGSSNGFWGGLAEIQNFRPVALQSDEIRPFDKIQDVCISSKVGLITYMWG